MCLPEHTPYFFDELLTILDIPAKLLAQHSIKTDGSLSLVVSSLMLTNVGLYKDISAIVLMISSSEEVVAKSSQTT